MKSLLVSVAVIAMLAAALSCWSRDRPVREHAAAPSGSTEGTKMLGRLPVVFVPNVGQWQHPARYVARVGAMTVFLEDKGWTFTLVERTRGKGKETSENVAEDAFARGVAVRLTFAGAGAAELVAEGQLPGRHNYFLGNQPTRWRSDVPLYSAVRYREVHPGIDVRAREQDGHFEYDLLLKPGADLESAEITVEGIEGMRVDEIGALVMETGLGPVRMPVPSSWEEGPGGERNRVACHYVLRGANRFGFEAPGRQRGWALVVDPGLVWSTFLGGGASLDWAVGLALDAQGAATVVGLSYSVDFPTTPGAFQTTHHGGEDAFVARLSSSGSSLVYSTFLGGASADDATAVALDAQGAATFVGETDSADFPSTPGAFSTSHNGGGRDAFVARLSPMGTTLVYSTFLGGASIDSANAIVLDAQGAATVVGVTLSPTFPTTPGAFDTTYNGGPVGNDAFVTRLSPTGSSLVYSTFLGGADFDTARAVALDAQGACDVAGWTNSVDFPTTPGAFDTTHNGGYDAFVARLSPSGSSLVYSTFLGGSGGEDRAFALARDAQDVVTIAGRTDSANFPTTPGAFDTTPNGGQDAFVTRLSPSGASLLYSTFLGGATHDWASALCLDTQGACTVAGRTDSSNFPATPGAFDVSYNIGPAGDAFVARLSPTGSSLVYSTFLGGTDTDQATAIALDARGACTVLGRTASTNFPSTLGSFSPSYNGFTDGFITRLDMLPTGVIAFGNSSPGCTGPLAISVNSMPRVGNAAFALNCGNAAPSSVGLIAFTAGALPAPVIVLGVEVWIDPSVLFVTTTVSSNPIGACEVPLPIANNPALAGMRLFTQFLWLGPATPPPCPPLGFSASNALDFTIQP